MGPKIPFFMSKSIVIESLCEKNRVFCIFCDPGRAGQNGLARTQKSIFAPPTPKPTGSKSNFGPKILFPVSKQARNEDFSIFGLIWVIFGLFWGSDTQFPLIFAETVFQIFSDFFAETFVDFVREFFY